MYVLCLKDNNYKGISLAKAVKDENPDYKSLYNCIKSISNKSISNLVENNENLLVFPHSLIESKDKIGESCIFKTSLDISDDIDYSKCKIFTNNMMGFIGKGNTQISISSRFCKNQEHDFFLHYMLQKVFNMNLFNLDFSVNSNGYFDLLIYMFPVLLKKAGKQGIYREYRTFKRNDSNVKGVIDIKRYIKSNIPFSGSIAYNSREYSYDNHVTQLIRHTVEYINFKKDGKNILSRDSETNKIVKQIYSATPSYSKNERQMIIGKNIKQVCHPYFTEYAPLQKLCLQILQYEKLCYKENLKQVYGILFDGAWLWEEYLFTVLNHYNKKIVHPRNKDGFGGVKLFNNSRTNYFPDFRLPKENCYFESDVILDAKYKDLKRDPEDEDFSNIKISIQREDKFQMVTYMHVQNAERGIFLYPYTYDGNVPEDAKIITSEGLVLKGQSGTIYSKGFPILSSASSLSSYVELMDRVGKTFTLDINSGIDSTFTG